MNDVGVIDRFTNVFSQYIDSGFGLLGNEMAFLTATLVVIDITLAGLFWAMGGDDIIGKLIKKTLYVGAFAFIINNFNSLASILFRSFAGLGLTASGSGLTEAQLLQPGRLATVGVDAGRPILHVIGQLAGFPDVFSNLDTITVLLIAWLIVIVSFFVLAVQLFVTLIEFKLTTLAGFVLVPFALWNKTAFLAERVLGNVVSSGIKVLVLAVIVGIGTGIFGEFTSPTTGDMTIDNALAIMLASLAMLGLGIFGPSIASGLVSGAPQLGAGAAAGTLLGATGLAVAGSAAATSAVRSATTLASGARSATMGGMRMAASATRTGMSATSSAASTIASGARSMGSAYTQGVQASGLKGAAGVAAGIESLAKSGAAGMKSAAKSSATAVGQGIRSLGNKTSAAFRNAASPSSESIAAAETTSSNNASSNPSSSAAPQAPPAWAKRMQTRQRISQGISAAAHSLRSGDHSGSGANPKLNPDG